MKKFCLVTMLLCLLLAGQAFAGEQKTDLTVEVVVPDGAAYAVIDVMDGVEARYRSMDYGDIFGEYSCAGYVKAYYMSVYGVDVQNLMDAGPPSPADLFVRASKPQRGDIIFYASPPNANNHSAIVKSFDGERITLIEQNYKWAQDGGTYTYLNRTVPYSENGADYEIWRLVSEEEIPNEIPEDLQEDLIEENFTEEAIPEDDVPFPDSPPPENDEPQEPDAPQEIPPPDLDLPPEVPPPDLNSPPEQITPPEIVPETVPAFNPAPSFEAIVTVGGMSIAVDGTDMPIGAPAIIENNRVMMPVRFVGYALGLNENDLAFDENSRSVIINRNGVSIIFTVGSDIIFVNQSPWLMDTPSFIRNDYAYLPLKYLADALGVRYEWDEAQGSVRFFGHSAA